MSASPSRLRGTRGRLAWLGLAVLLLGLGLVGWPGLRREAARASARRLPDHGALPAFTLEDQSGQPFSSAQLRGHVAVADFFFTRCPTVCPVLTERMARLQARALERGLDVRFLSFSVDPRYDTPERLAAYAREHGLDTRNWKLLTGPLEQVESAVLDGFRVMMGRDADAGDDDFLSVFHGEHFVLVDAEGRLRGYYRVTEGTSGLDGLLDDMTALARAAE